MLIGQNRVGKISLKKFFLGMMFDFGEFSIEGIEVDFLRFELDVDCVMNWQFVKNEKFIFEFVDDIVRFVVGELCFVDEEQKLEIIEEIDIVQSDVIQGVLVLQVCQVKVGSLCRM